MSVPTHRRPAMRPVAALLGALAAAAPAAAAAPETPVRPAALVRVPDSGPLRLAQNLPPTEGSPLPLTPTLRPSASPTSAIPPVTGAATSTAPVVDAAGGAVVAMEVSQGRILRFARPVDTVLIADPNVADIQVISPELAYVFGNRPGRTNLFAVTDGGEMVASLVVDIMPGVATAERDLRAARPGGAVGLGYLGDRPVVRGPVGDLTEVTEAAALASRLSPAGVPPLNQTTYAGAQQVNLRVRFIEVGRNDGFRLGINWQALIDAGDFAFGLQTGNFFLPGGGLTGESYAVGVGAFDGGDVDVDLLIDALKSEGYVNVLAEPNLTAVSGQTADFLAGGEFPIPVPQGDDTITVEYKSFGVSLAFTPTLLPSERIALRVRPEVSQLTDNGAVAIQGFSVPALTVRRADTTIELASGQSFAIAGLFQRQINDIVSRVPLLGDIPVLGQLFRSKRFQRNETEVVILITPYIVRPTPARALTTPADSFESAFVPSDARLPARGLAGFIVN